MLDSGLLVPTGLCTLYALLEPRCSLILSWSPRLLQVIYLSSLIRSILALHKLIDNKEQRLWQEREAAKPKEIDAAKGATKGKDGAAADGADGKKVDGKENSEPAGDAKK